MSETRPLTTLWPVLVYFAAKGNQTSSTSEERYASWRKRTRNVSAADVAGITESATKRTRNTFKRKHERGITRESEDDGH